MPNYKIFCCYFIYRRKEVIFCHSLFSNRYNRMLLWRTIVYFNIVSYGHDYNIHNITCVVLCTFCAQLYKFSHVKLNINNSIDYRNFCWEFYIKNWIIRFVCIRWSSGIGFGFPDLYDINCSIWIYWEWKFRFNSLFNFMRNWNWIFCLKN